MTIQNMQSKFSTAHQNMMVGKPRSTVSWLNQEKKRIQKKLSNYIVRHTNFVSRSKANKMDFVQVLCLMLAISCNSKESMNYLIDYFKGVCRLKKQPKEKIMSDALSL